MTELYTLYASYLDRMYDKSDELVLVDEETIPFDCNRAGLEELATAD